MRQFPILFLSLLAFILFGVFSYLVHKNLFTQFDFDTTVRLQDNISSSFDGHFSFLSEIGNFEPMIIVLVVLLILRKKIWGVIVFGLFGILHVIELFGKNFVEHLPPPQFMLRTKELFDFPEFHVRAEFSYPSGHSARALFLSIILGFIAARSEKLSHTQKIFIISILVVYDITMLISRVYLGEHWTSDVVGGALLGLSLGILAALTI